MTKNKLISAALAGSLAVSAVLCGCTGSGGGSSTVSTASTVNSSADGSLPLPEDGGYLNTYTMSNDKYRTYYEIFPYAFYDSDGDEIGDLNGITLKLEYLNDGDPATRDDLGVDAIWLMPIMQSPSYHKYNVTDYYTVDKKYGTNDDFKKLLDEAHKRGINVIIDLVINHTSRTCEWYQKAIEELKAGKSDGYAKYYNFSQEEGHSGWAESAVGGWYYECRFDSDMPDLNLQNPTVREELEKVVKFWVDMGVDGFRLDAVLWYETDLGNEASISDLKWLYDYGKSIKPDIYMVGECWSDFVTISEFYESGIDSFFNFKGQGSSGEIYQAVRKRDVKNYIDYIIDWNNDIKDYNPNAIDALFLSNHDNVRSANYLITETEKRLNAALYLLMPNNPFIYYGEEIRMKGSANDPEKRRGMYWSATDETGYVSDIPGADDEGKPDQSVEEALKDPESLLNFYKRIIALRNQNPEIARGTLKLVSFGDDASVAGYVSTYQDSSVMVIFNLDTSSKTITVPKDEFEIKEVKGYLKAHVEGENVYDEDDLPAYSGTITVKGQEVTLPAQSVIVLK